MARNVSTAPAAAESPTDHAARLTRRLDRRRDELKTLPAADDGPRRAELEAGIARLEAEIGLPSARAAAKTPRRRAVT